MFLLNSGGSYKCLFDWRLEMTLDKPWLKYTFRFVCPVCGHTYWESIENKDNTFTRYCRGKDCTFEWHENNDELFVFVLWSEIVKVVSEIFEDELGKQNICH